MITESLGGISMSAGSREFRLRKTRVDEARSVDILTLQRKGVFTKESAWSGLITWSRNEEVAASLSFVLEYGESGPTGVRFMYTITDKDTGERKDYTYTVPVVSTRCNYGGMRWWFICPIVMNGRACQRPCRIIYRPPGAEYFGCRECHELTYESRQRHREKFNEGIEKPYLAALSAHQELARVRSWKKKEKIWRKLARA
jgi:hypothetical protein